MNTYVALINYTGQGISNISAAPERAHTIRGFAKKNGITILEFFWTTGPHDGLLIFTAEGAAASALMLHIGSQGNVTTQLSRAYDLQEFRTVLKKVA
jgi:uncharacterized protein with GYD domain